MHVDISLIFHARAPSL